MIVSRCASFARRCEVSPLKHEPAALDRMARLRQAAVKAVEEFRWADHLHHGLKLGLMKSRSISSIDD